MNGILSFIIGQAEPGQRKMAFGGYTSLILSLALFSSILGGWIGPQNRLEFFTTVSVASIAGIKWIFGLLMGGNGIEHIAKAVKGRNETKS